MMNIFSPPTSIGLEYTQAGIKTASVSKDSLLGLSVQLPFKRSGSNEQGGGGQLEGKSDLPKDEGLIQRLQEIFKVEGTARINSLSILNPNSDDVKRLYMHHPILTTAMKGREVLVRPLRMPLVKQKDIDSALVFQAEPILPYSVDQAVFGYQVVSKSADSTDLTLLSVHKDNVKLHLEEWGTLHVEPEKVSSIPAALCEFATAFISRNKTFLVLHIGDREMTCALIKEGKLWASFAQSEGVNLLLEAQAKDEREALPDSLEGWKQVELDQKSALGVAIGKLQREVAKICFSLSKECKEGLVEGVALTGEIASYPGLSELLVAHLTYPLLACVPSGEYSSEHLQAYAVPIGLALGSLPGNAHKLDFRSDEYAYPHPWRRLAVPVALYFISIFLLSFAFYFFGQQYLRYEEDQVKQQYVDFLGSLNKTHEQFEKGFVAKNRYAHDRFDGDIPKVEQLDREDFAQRLAFLQKELDATPDSFPLFANIPRVSDILAWLSQHSAVVAVDEKGNKEAKLQIENFNYTMMKRPQHGKKQEKYQVKVELEFTSPTPKLAREFHDALIAPNDWIDPKGEVKWNSNKGKYKTSFFLKDKTVYPSS